MSRASSRNFVGSAACVRHLFPRLMLSDLTYGLQVSLENLDPEFLVLALSSQRARWQIESAAKGTSPSMQKISQGDVENLLIWMPALSRQQEIVRIVHRQHESTRTAIQKIEDFITLSRERRSALITAAVTGQIDVRAAS